MNSSPNRRNAGIPLLLALLCVPHAVNANDIQGKIHAAQHNAQQIHAKLHQQKKELHHASIRLENLRGQLESTAAAISTVHAQLGRLAVQERSTQRRLNWNTIQLAAANKSLALHNRLLQRRLVDIYESGSLGYLAVLLSAHTFSDFVERWQDIRLVIASNERAIRERKAAEERVAGMQRDLQRAQLAVAREQQAQQRAENQLSTLAIERRNLVAIAANRRRHVAIAVATLEELSAAQEQQLEALIRERQAQLEAARQARRAAAGIAGSQPQHISGAPSSFSWPVTGTITSPYGWRQNPFGGGPEFHDGLDIAAPMGTTITAAASGTIIMAQWYGGYGNYVLIDHGGGISTGYGHMSAIYVSVGQHVKRGQAIGAVGSTGASTGPHVHFEVRRNGKPIDPTPWLHG